MSFIVAIQLKDSIIVASDKRSFTVMGDGTLSDQGDDTNKLYAWQNGVITGVGEATVIDRAVEFFIKISKSKIEDLSKCLKISRLLRELEVEHFQVQTTKLLYSDYVEKGVQLYSIQPDGTGEYQCQKCKKNEVLLWMFNPDISAITDELKYLYINLKAREEFDLVSDWFNYYIDQLKAIYKKQSKQDASTSASFDYFFQTIDDYTYGHIPNRHSNELESY